MPKDHDRKHQQLMTELSLMNARIRGHEAHMRKHKGKLHAHKWENLVRDLKNLNSRKDEINRKIRRLG